MKKFAIFAAALAVAFATFAALDFQTARAIPALAPQTISAGATNEAALAVRGLRGQGEVIVTATGKARRTGTLSAPLPTLSGSTPFAFSGEVPADKSCVVEILKEYSSL